MMDDKTRRMTDNIGRGNTRVQVFILRLMATENDADRKEDNDTEAKEILGATLDSLIQDISDMLPEGYYLKLDDY